MTEAVLAAPYDPGIAADPPAPRPPEAERPAPAWRRRALRSVRALFTPLLPDDYLELVNPLWSTRELRARVERVDRETAHAVSVVLRPGWGWPGHEAGQYVRVGLSVDGVQHWRAYSISSPPGRADGRITITPKLVEAGTVTPRLVRHARPGDVVRLGEVEGTFVLPRPLPARLLLVTAGSGITPVMSMLRALEQRGSWPDVAHVHCARDGADVIFGAELRALAARRPALRLHEHHSRAAGRLRAVDLARLVPDWREREAFVCGPAAMLEELGALWEREGDPARLRVERFAPAPSAAPAAPGSGGTVAFRASGVHAESDGTTPILDAGERAGLALRHGCRMGICHSCVASLRSGRVRDLRTGRVFGEPGEPVRLCVSAPEGPVELDL